MVGVVNVYATIIQNRSNPSEYAGELFTSIKAYGYSLDFDSETPVFDDYSQEKLVFDYSEILNLPEPTIYVPDQGEVIKLNDIKFGSHPNYCPDNNGYVPYPMCRNRKEQEQRKTAIDTYIANFKKLPTVIADWDSRIWNLMIIKQLSIETKQLHFSSRMDNK